MQWQTYLTSNLKANGLNETIPSHAWYTSWYTLLIGHVELGHRWKLDFPGLLMALLLLTFSRIDPHYRPQQSSPESRATRNYQLCTQEHEKSLTAN